MAENMVELRKKKSGTLGFGLNFGVRMPLGGTRGIRQLERVVVTKSLSERDVFFRNFVCSFFSHDCTPKRMNFSEDCVQAHKVL